MKGQAWVANKAGSNKASKTTAVMTRCLSKGSPEKSRQIKRAANWAAHQAVMSHGTKFKLKPP
jgi:hypothetical protein